MVSTNQEASIFSRRGVRIICYVLAFLAINLYFGNLYRNARTVDADDLITEPITVDEINYHHSSTRRGSSTRFWIVANKTEFNIHIRSLRQHDLSVSAFRDQVSEGDQLVISYFDISPFSNSLVVVEAYNDSGVLLTIEGYNASCIEPRVMAIIFYFLATCVYSFVMITSEGWFMQWIRKRNSAREANAQTWEEAAKDARKAEREKYRSSLNEKK